MNSRWCQGGSDGTFISYHRSGPLYIIGGSFHGPIATKSDAKVFDVGASFNNSYWNKTAFGCLLHGDEWRLGEGSPYVKTGSNCTSGYGYSVRTGSEITALPPSARVPPAAVAFTSLSQEVPPQVFQMQDATSGTVHARAGTTNCHCAADRGDGGQVAGVSHANLQRRQCVGAQPVKRAIYSAMGAAICDDV